MNNLKLAVFATQSPVDLLPESHIAHALLLQDVNDMNLICEIHIGKMITRFITDDKHFLEDMLWQLNEYCQIPSWEVECDMHYPSPIPIEQEIDVDECTRARESVHSQMIESGFNFYVVNWNCIGLEEKVSEMKQLGISIDMAGFMVKNNYDFSNISKR